MARDAREADPTGDGGALFRRVWARVMPGDRPDCPILVLPPPEEGGAPPALPVPAGGPARRDLPPEEALLARLQDLAAARAVLAADCARLARRWGGARGRSLSALAAAERNQLRRLEAACFLLSGVQPLPGPPPRSLPPAPLPAALRRLFVGEGRWLTLLAEARGAAEEAGLGELAAGLAGESANWRRALARLAKGL